MKRTMVCGDCWQDLRPDQYEPLSSIFGECSRCEQLGFLSRVRSTEVEANPVTVSAIWDKLEDRIQPATEAELEARALLRPQS